MVTKREFSELTEKVNAKEVMLKQILHKLDSLKPKEFNLKEIKSELINAKCERDRILSINSRIRTNEQKNRLNMLNKLIPQVEIKLNLDMAGKKMKKKNLKLVGDRMRGYNLQEISKNPFPKKVVKRAKMTTNMFDEVTPLRDKKGNIIYETIVKKLYKEPKCRIENGHKVWTIPKDYPNRIVAAMSQPTKPEKTTQMIEAKIRKSKVTIIG